MTDLTPETLTERRVVDAVIACLPMSDDGTGHVADCGLSDDEMKCGCFTLPGRIADVIRDALAAEKAAREEERSDVLIARANAADAALMDAQLSATQLAEERDAAEARAVNAEQERAKFRDEANRENQLMLNVQDELQEALVSIAEHKACIADMRRRKEAAEARVAALEERLAAVGELDYLGRLRALEARVALALECLAWDRPYDTRIEAAREALSPTEKGADDA